MRNWLKIEAGYGAALQDRSFCKERAVYIARPDFLDLLAKAGQIRRPSTYTDGTFANAFAAAIPEVFVMQTDVPRTDDALAEAQRVAHNERMKRYRLAHSPSQSVFVEPWSVYDILDRSTDRSTLVQITSSHVGLMRLDEINYPRRKGRYGYRYKKHKLK